MIQRLLVLALAPGYTWTWESSSVARLFQFLCAQTAKYAPSASILSIKYQVSYVTCEEFGQLNIPQCISPPLMTAAMHDGKYMNQCTWSKVAYLLTIFPQLCYARQGCNLALPLLHCSLGTLTALWSKMLQLPHFCCGFGF